MAGTHDLQVTIDALASFPGQLERIFECFPPEGRGWRPTSWVGIPSERLTATEQVCHIRDIEIEGYGVRFHRTRTEINPVLPDLPGELMASERHYGDTDPVAALRAFAVARASTVAAIQEFSADELRREAIFEGKRITLGGLVHLLSSHDYQHLAGLQWLLANLQRPSMHKVTTRLKAQRPGARGARQKLHLKRTDGLRYE